MRFFQLILILVFLSCQNNSESVVPEAKEKEYKTYLLSVLKESDSLSKLDSFRVVRIDTISLQDKYRTIFLDLYNDNEYQLTLAQSDLELYKNKLDIANLTRGLDQTLYSTYKRDAEDQKEKIDKRREKINHSLKLQDSVQKLMATADSTKPVGYQAVCFYQLRKKDASVTKDTAYLTLNLDKNIVERNEFYELE